LRGRHNIKEDKTLRINLDFQDQNLTPEAREILIGLLHRLEKEPERFTGLATQLEPERTLAPGELAESLRKARAEREPPTPITPQEFFESMRKTKGFESKEEAHRHIQDLRNEWD
jgi:hypothetical protein